MDGANGNVCKAVPLQDVKELVAAWQEVATRHAGRKKGGPRPPEMKPGEPNRPPERPPQEKPAEPKKG
jgi:hypothetical protein